MKTRTDIEGLSRELLVPYYLLSSYLYYHRHQSPLTDDAFDFLCIRLQKEWFAIRHRHKKAINKADLVAGSCFLRVDQFPLIVRNAAEGFLETCRTTSQPDKPKRRISRAAPPTKLGPKRLIRRTG